MGDGLIKLSVQVEFIRYVEIVQRGLLCGQLVYYLRVLVYWDGSLLWEDFGSLSILFL